MHSDIAHRGRLLYIALGFLGLDAVPAEMPPQLHALPRPLGGSVFVTSREHS